MPAWPFSKVITTMAISASLWRQWSTAPRAAPCMHRTQCIAAACIAHQQQPVAHSSLQASLKAEYESLHPLLACLSLESTLQVSGLPHPSPCSAPQNTAVFAATPYLHWSGKPHHCACSPAGAAAAAAEPALLEQPAVAGTPADDRLFVQRLKHMSYNGQYDELFARPIDAKKPVSRGGSCAVLSTPPGPLRPRACPCL